MKFSLIVAALGVPCTLAMPSPSGDGNSLEARANPKLNQYKSLDDCKNDKNILFHAAPTTGNCYSFDGQTGAFFVNTAGFLASRLHKGYGCSGESIGLSYTGSCFERGDWNSFVLR